jgi:F0F1-type ATP synthase membrane subunit c/vacuolar-type H+-ATPase subunit K
VGLSYGVLREGGPQVLGIAGAELVAVALTVGFALLLAVPAIGMARGRAFGSSCRALARLPNPPLRRAMQRNAARIDALDAASTQVLRHNLRNLVLSFLACLGGWLIAVLESYLLLSRMGLSSSLRVAYVIESVGSIFRMIFFFVPSGIGAQDVSFVALFKLYRFPAAPAGAFVLLKRGKELCWIGIGFVLLALQRRSPPAPGASVDGSRDGTYAAPAQERSE